MTEQDRRHVAKLWSAIVRLHGYVPDHLLHRADLVVKHAKTRVDQLLFASGEYLEPMPMLVSIDSKIGE
jgi:hypothetical protein